MPNGKHKAIALAAIAGIVIIELTAMFRGMNGIALATSLSLIAGIGGFSFGRGKRNGVQ